MRFQIRSYSLNSLPRSTLCNSDGVRNTSPDGRIASCASCAFFDLPAYVRGFSGTESEPYSFVACVRAAETACCESATESVRI